jgi:hypothetical protein
MKRGCLTAVVVLMLGVGGSYFGYQLLYPTYTYRYRLSEMFPQLLTERDHISRVFGEAVFVDLGQGKNLVGLLAAGPSGEDVDYPGRIVFQAFKLDGNDPNTPKRLPQLQGKRDLDIYHSSQYDVTRRFLPTFVTFGDLTDFKSVKIAPPGLFDEIFGVGYKLRNVSIEMTRDPITEQISKKLPWLPHPGYFNDRVGCGPGDPTYCLHGGHLIRSS